MPAFEPGSFNEYLKPGAAQSVGQGRGQAYLECGASLFFRSIQLGLALVQLARHLSRFFLPTCDSS